MPPVPSCRCLARHKYTTTHSAHHPGPSCIGVLTTSPSSHTWLGGLHTTGLQSLSQSQPHLWCETDLRLTVSALLMQQKLLSCARPKLLIVATTKVRLARSAVHKRHAVAGDAAVLHSVEHSSAAASSRSGLKNALSLLTGRGHTPRSHCHHHSSLKVVTPDL